MPAIMARRSFTSRGYRVSVQSETFRHTPAITLGDKTLVAGVIDETKQDSAETAWRELAFQLLQAIGEQPVYCGEAERDAFRKIVADASASLRESSTASPIAASQIL